MLVCSSRARTGLLRPACTEAVATRANTSVSAFWIMSSAITRDRKGANTRDGEGEVFAEMVGVSVG